MIELILIKVKQVLWSNDDNKLISCGMDGGKLKKNLIIIE